MQNPSAHRVVSEVERAPASIIQGLAPIGTATVHEAIGRRGFVGPHITPIQTGTRLAGSAITVSSHPGDNLMTHAAVSVAQPGDVIIVSHTAPSTHGGFGDLLATSMQAIGVVAFLTDAAVRDTSDLREMGFPCWSQYISCQGAVKATPGSVNVPIRFGETIVNPGDVVCADDDGVVVVARDEAEWALEMSNKRLENESATRARLEAKEHGFDFYGLRDKAIELGIEFT